MEAIKFQSCIDEVIDVEPIEMDESLFEIKQSSLNDETR